VVPVGIVEETAPSSSGEGNVETSAERWTDLGNRWEQLVKKPGAVNRTKTLPKESRGK